MQRGFQTELERIALIGISLLIFGYINGHVLLTLLLGGLIYMLWTLRRIVQIYRWLDGGARGLPPDATGIWGDISDQLYRLQKRSLRSQQSLKSLSIRVQKITSALADGILILDSENTLEWWNPAAEKLLSLRSDDREQVITNLIRDPRFVEFILQSDFPKPLEITAPGNKNVTLMFSAARFGKDEIVLVVRDITRLRNLETMRKEFVGNISHELRTPLTVISGYIETLESMSDQLPGPFQRALEQMHHQTNRMSNLANDLVMLSKLESVNQHAPSDPVSLKPMLDQIATDARALSQGEHDILVEVPEELTLLGSSSQLQSAISNLVFNAVKHNPEGASIEIQARRNGEGIFIEVSDDGVGIDPIHVPRLTERFYRVDSSRTSKSGGTGLGLAIVKHVLLSHDGSLNIESTLGKGTTFTCKFPNSRVG